MAIPPHKNITVLKSLDDLPPGAVQIHLYPHDRVLMPRGSMKKESLGLRIYEQLMDNYEYWTNPKYGDNPTREQLMATLRENLTHETECAWQAFLGEIDYEGTVRDKSD